MGRFFVFYEIVAALVAGMREHILFTVGINLTDIRLGFVNAAELHAISFVEKRAREGRFAAGTTAKTFATALFQPLFNDVLFQQHQIATLNLHLERSYNFFINFLHLALPQTKQGN